MKTASSLSSRVFNRARLDPLSSFCFSIATAFMVLSGAAHAKPIERLLDYDPAVLPFSPTGLVNFLPAGPCDLPLTVPYLENFEGMSVPGLPTCWTPLNGDWSLSNVSSFTDLHPLSGTKYLSTTGMGGANIWSPGLTLEAAISYDFAFWHATNGYLGPYPPGMLEVELYVNTLPNSTGAMLLGVLSQAELTESNFTELRKSFVPTAGGIYYFGLYARSGTGNIAFDDFSVSPTVACAAPTALTAAHITDHAVDMSWVASASNPANGYQWEVRTSGAPGTGSTGLFASGNLPAGTTSVTLGGLQSDTPYAIYVRGNCSGILSPWAGSVEITTHCEPADLPYFQDFSSSSPSGLPTCMRRQNFGINFWSVNLDQGSMFFRSGMSPQPTWLFTNGLNLTEGHSYQLQYSARGGGSTMLKMRVAFGTDATQGGMTTVIHDHTSSPTSLQTFTWNFTANTTGVHYIGFNAYDGVPLYAWELDDISVVEQTWDCEVAAALPYHENFEDAILPGLPSCMSRTNSNNPNWVTQGFNGAGMYGNWAVALPRTQVESYPYQYLQDWLFTPRFSLVGGTEYTLSYLYSSDGAPYTESMFVAYGMDPTVGGMVPPQAISLANHPSITSSNAEQHSVSFTPAISGIYYIGFAHTSALNQGHLYVDDIRLGLTECLPPTDLALSGITANSMVLSWTPSASSPVTDYVMEARTSGAPGSGDEGLEHVESYIGEVAQSYFTAYEAPDTYQVYLRARCGVYGSFTFSDWAGPESFTNELCPPVALPYTEDFNACIDERLPSCMSVQHTADSPMNGAYNWNHYAGAAMSDGVAGDTIWFYTPGLILTAGTNYTLKYKYRGRPHLVAYGGAPDKGSMNSVLADMPNTPTWPWVDNQTYFTPTSSGNFYIGFRSEGGHHNWTFIDDISVFETPAPIELMADYITLHSALLSWSMPGDQPTNGFQWEVRTTGLPGSGNSGLGASGNSLYFNADTAFSLSPGTTYSLYVRSDWGNGSYSPWAGPHVFTTLSCPGNALVVAITTDSWSYETTWEITDASHVVVATGGPTAAQANMLVSETICLGDAPGNACYGFRLMDSYGDGIANGGWELRTVGGKLLLRDGFVSGSVSPATPAANPSYGTSHSFCLPAGPANIAPTECGIFNNLLGNKVYANKVAGAANYQFEFSDPDAGFFRRIARPYNYVLFGDMVTNPLVPGVKYFARVRTDRDGAMLDAHFGSGCEMGIGLAAVPCTQLIPAPAYGHSCNETRMFNTNNSFIYATPVQGATEYQFRIFNTQEGYDQTFTRSTYILQLKWNSSVAPPLINGYTYQVEMNVKVNSVYSGFCASTCNITIDNSSPAMSMAQANGTATMWPNPVRDGQVNLNIDGLVDADQHITVEIQDIYGKQVFAKEFGNSGARFNTILNLSSDIPSGVYMVNMTVNGERTVQRLSIIR